MPRLFLATTLVVLTFAPFVGADSILPVSPLINGDFDLGYVVGGLTPARAALDHCVGVGHQVFQPVTSPWGAWALDVAEDAADDPASLAGRASEETFVDDATGWPVAHAASHVSDPSKATGCAASLDVAQLNAWGFANDRGVGWSGDAGTSFFDVNDDGDVEVVIPRVPAAHGHNLYQSWLSTTQAFSANFDSFDLALESGKIPSSAHIQIGLSFSPGYVQSPFVGVFWDGGLQFRANDMAPDPDGVVRMSPVADGEIVCNASTGTCPQFRAAFNAADAAGKAELLSQARIIQVSFWSFNGPLGPVVMDDLAIVGATSFAETTLARHTN